MAVDGPFVLRERRPGTQLLVQEAMTLDEIRRCSKHFQAVVLREQSLKAHIHAVRI
jgi:hypothetical protein